MNRTVVFAFVFTILIAGCAGNQPGKKPQTTKDLQGAGGAPGSVASIPAVSKLTPVTEKTRVSPQGHRLAEFMVARNPLDHNNLVVTSGDYDNLGTGTMSCVLYVSKDGGVSWVQSKPIPVLDRPHLQFDGWVSFDRNGVAHYICLDYFDGPNTQPFYSKSTDGGMTWSAATQILPLGSCDKSAMFADDIGRIYAACSSSIARSDDQGKTWMPSVRAGSVANGFVEDGAGILFLNARAQGGSGVYKSSDRGDTWTPVSVGPIAIPPGYNDQNRWVRQEPWTTTPSLALSPATQHLFMGQQSWNSTTSLYDLYVFRSVDHGASFQRVANPAFKSDTCKPCSITKPTVAVDDQGRLGLLVQFVNDGGHIKEVYFAASGDEGDTWTEPLTLSKTAPPNEWQNAKAFTPNSGGGMYMANYQASHPNDNAQIAIGVALTSAVQELQMRWNGEYWGMETSPQGFVTLWIDHANDGVPQIYSRVVRAE